MKNITVLGAGLALLVGLSAAAMAASATRDECAKAMARIKAWEGDASPLQPAELDQCVKQGTAEQARCIIAAATKEAGRACIEKPAPDKAAARAVDPLDQKPAACRLTAAAPKPLAGALLHAWPANGGDELRPHQSLLWKIADGRRVVEPTDLRRVVPADEELREALLLPTRLVAVRGEELVSGPPSGASLTAVGVNGRARAIDAVAVGRDTYVAGMFDGGLFVARLDAAGKLIARKDLRERAFAVRIARTSSGALALAWLVSAQQATELRLAWVGTDAAVRGKPAVVDRAPEEQTFANVTLAPHRDGVVVAWDPIVGKGERETALVELRAFHASPGGAPAALRTLATTSQSWVVAGSAGGVLPNWVQALPLGRETALLWMTYEHDAGGLDAALVDGGARVRLTSRGGAPIARSDGASATVLLQDQNGGNATISVRCEK